MKTLNKKQKQFLNNYNESDMYSLRDAYGRYSRAKEQAEDEIIKEMESVGGHGYKVCTAGHFIFTCAYKVDDENGTKLVYHTPTARHEFYII